MVVLLIAVVSASALMLLVFFSHFSVKAPIPISQDTAVQSAYWDGRIAAVGAANAYAELHTAADALDPSAQHLLAHSFGGSLYRTTGLPGFSVCNGDFSYGCYHEFIGRAIIAQGTGVIARLAQQCAGDIGCEHGIGHGLVSYLGYDNDHLNKAVTLCTSLGEPESLQGCTGGVFMEYNLRTMLSSEGSVRQMTDPDTAYTPCDSYAGEVAQSCYLYQPQWWWSILSAQNNSDSAVFIRMARLCNDASATMRAACFEGIGLMAPQDVKYAPAASAALCQNITELTAERFWCDIGAVTVYAGTGRKNDGEKICATLRSQTETAQCLRYASGEITIDNDQHSL